MTDIDTLYTSLYDYVQELEKTFLLPYLTNPLSAPDDYKHQVKAYCVLSHAAFEEFFEEVAMKVMLHCLEAWYTRRIVTDSLLSLIGYYHSVLKDEDEKKVRRSFDYLRKLLDEAKRKFSQDIHRNQGAGIRYLKALLEPVAVEISNDALLLNSLNNLARERGNFAHRGFDFSQRIQTIISPNDAKNYVQDCLKLCEEIRSNANTRLV